jgi:putative glutamine amidotransferase
MAKPWIGIPTRYHDKTEVIGQIRHYLDAVIWAGGAPLMIPTVNDRSLVREYAERIDGVLLPGSPTDIDPAIYGAEPHPKLGKRYVERDATDFVLLEYADQNRMPLFGICFGAQSLNVYRGGTLVQDIPSIVSGAGPHEDGARHLVRVERNSLISHLAGADSFEVNSHHHQSVERAGRDLRVAAVDPDGVVEAVEDSSERFVVGVQWHPERGWRDDRVSQELFKRFVQEAAKKKRS